MNFDELDYIASKSHLSEETVLQRVDEYTLYCFYLGFDPLLSRPYSSPLRDGDSMPSFSVFRVHNKDVEFMWKDSGGDGDSGDIFKLIRRLFGDTMKECYSRINKDFNLGFNSSTPAPTNYEKIVLKDPPKQSIPSSIRVKRREWKKYDLSYWAQFGITLPTLLKYKVAPVSFFWLNDYQQYPINADKLAYVYSIRTKKKIYQPYSKSRKFRNDMDFKLLEGYDQLTFTSDTLIITKAMKDIMLLHELGYEAVAPRGESVPIHENFLKFFRTKYKNIYILFDNDGKHKADIYPFPEIYVPKESHEKDITDFRKRYGHKQTILLLKKLIGH